jgi:hypothetical protein
MGQCHYCGPTEAELRPYGPGGSTVCFKCAMETPERKSATEAAFGALLEGASVFGTVVVGLDGGPVNVSPETLSRILER